MYIIVYVYFVVLLKT